jgi:hypothetical protein
VSRVRNQRRLHQLGPQGYRTSMGCNFHAARLTLQQLLRGQRQSAEEVSDRIEFARDSCLAPADADVQGACQNSRANSVRCARLHSRKEAPVHGTVDEALLFTTSSQPPPARTGHCRGPASRKARNVRNSPYNHATAKV